MSVIENKTLSNGLQNGSPGWKPRDVRYSIDWNVRITHTLDSTLHSTAFESPLAARIINISMGGLALFSPQPFLAGQRLRVEVEVPTFISERVLLANPMVLHIQITWCKELLTENQIGGLFMYLSPVIRRGIQDAFTEFTDGVVYGVPHIAEKKSWKIPNLIQMWKDHRSKKALSKIDPP